jgi:hypothetical protein
MCENCNCRDRVGNEKGVPQLEVTPELTPPMVEDFRVVFRAWLEEGQNQEALENSGLGNVKDLAHRASRWAARLRMP